MTRARIGPVVSVFLSCILAVGAVGCASGKSASRRQSIIEKNLAMMPPPTKPLAEYGTFRLQPVAMSPDVSSDERKVQVANQLAQQFGAQVGPSLARWSTGQGGSLDVQLAVLAMHVPSGAARFWVGAWAGDATIDVDLILTDTQTGTVIARPRASMRSSAMAGAWSGGDSDRNLLDYATDVLAEYLVRNHP